MTVDKTPAGSTDAAAYTGPSVRATFDGFLFDMDGTIIDSTAAVVKHWHTIGHEIGVDPKRILETSHGRRSMDVLKILAPDKANWEYILAMEGRMPKLYGNDAIEIPGARTLLDVLRAKHVPWTIVTSGSEPLLSGWLDRLQLPRPEHLVTAESVEHGKPDPQGYIQGREALGLGCVMDSTAPGYEVLVLEDSPAGIRAGKAAGCAVLGLVTSHSVTQVIEAGPDWIVKDLESVRVVSIEAQGDGRIRTTLEFSNTVVVPSKDS